MSLRWRLGSVGALVLLLAYLALANFFPAERRAQAWYLPDEGLRLGLDLQGGIHLVISPDLEAGVAQELGHIKDGLAQQIEEKDITGARLFVEGDSLEVTVADQVAVLTAGDAYYFRSDQPHQFRNAGKEPCELISACTPPSF